MLIIRAFTVDNYILFYIQLWKDLGLFALDF